MSDAIEQVAERYAPRILALLDRFRAELIEAGYEPDSPYDECVDDYRWGLDVFPKGHWGHIDTEPPPVGITIRLDEAVDYGEEPKDGINFSIDIIEWGGRILGILSPYNYTDAVWVDAKDAEAVEERFLMIEDAEGIVECVEGADGL